MTIVNSPEYQSVSWVVETTGTDTAIITPASGERITVVSWNIHIDAAATSGLVGLFYLHFGTFVSGDYVGVCSLESGNRVSPQYQCRASGGVGVPLRMSMNNLAGTPTWGGTVHYLIG